ncbi:hypothetical protein MP228_007146 [Amoeboaphelidium protococcarum]|nr:hypothetical protein MP228_007146 [Amoeboaphelidium protococcarum]
MQSAYFYSVSANSVTATGTGTGTGAGSGIGPVMFRNHALTLPEHEYDVTSSGNYTHIYAQSCTWPELVPAVNSTPDQEIIMHSTQNTLKVVNYGFLSNSVPGHQMVRITQHRVG